MDILCISRGSCQLFFVVSLTREVSENRTEAAREVSENRIDVSHLTPPADSST